MINRLPWHKKLRTSSANNLDKINEVIDYINHSDISEVALSESISGRIVQAGKAASLKDLTVHGESIQDGTPTPENPVPIEVVRGKNLLSPRPRTAITVNGITYTAYNDGSIEMHGTATADSDWVIEAIGTNDIIVPEGNYTFSVTGLVDGLNFIVSGGGNGNGYPYRELTNATPSTTGTVTDGTKPFNYIQTRVMSGKTINTTIYPQLELGTTPTPYVPYGSIGLQIGETVTTIPLPSKDFAASLSNDIVDVLTIDSAGKWDWTNETDEIVFDGSNDEQWATVSGYDNLFRIDNVIPDAATAKAYSLCNRFVRVVSAASNMQSGQYKADISGANQRLIFKYSGASTIEEWRTWLASNNVTLLYPLATPTTESGYIEPPAITDGDEIEILATITPIIDVSWWSYQDITDLITALKAYVDYKTSDEPSTLGMHLIQPIPNIGIREDISNPNDFKIADDLESEE